MSIKVKKYKSEGRAKQASAISGDNNPAKRPEVRQQISESKTGIEREQFSAEWLANMSIAHSGENNSMYGKNHSDETKELIRQLATGRVQSEDTKRKIAEGMRGHKKPLIHCTHCSRDIAVNGYARFHGDNCKMKATKSK